MPRPDPTTDHDLHPTGLSWRDPVLWLVIGPPVAAVIAGLLTVWIAATHRDPLVTDSVHKVGVTWQDAPAPTPPVAPTPAASPDAVPAPEPARDAQAPADGPRG